MRHTVVRLIDVSEAQRCSWHVDRADVLKNTYGCFA